MSEIDQAIWAAAYAAEFQYTYRCDKAIQVANAAVLDLQAARRRDMVAYGLAQPPAGGGFAQ